MTLSNQLTWDEAMRRAHQAVTVSEQLYDDIDSPEGRPNGDIGILWVPRTSSVG